MGTIDYLQGSSGSGLQGSSGAALQGGSSNQLFPQTSQTSTSVGVKAASPQTSVVKPKITLPSNQVAPLDLSSRYANVGGTIYDTQDKVKFSNPTDFFNHAKGSGYNVAPGNWNLKFNTSYTPTGSEGVYGQASVPTSQVSSNGGLNTGLIGQAINTANQSGVINTTNNPNSQPYTPPNQGTTGVSQGGIIGNLIRIANTETPEVTLARKNLQDLQNNYADQDKNIYETSGDLSLAGGREGLLNKLFAQKETAAQTAVQNALNSQGQQITANQGAGQLNAPITGVPYGTQTIQPSQPNGSTTSGAMNLNSIIGTRVSPVDGKTTEYFNSQTGQGFSNPQALADFVNQQMPGAGATAQNVFQILKNQGSGQGTGDVVSPSDPFYQNMLTYAQSLASGQPGVIPSSVTGNPALQAQLIRMAQSINPSFNYNAALGSANAQQSNVATGGTAAVNAGNSLYQKAYADYQNLNQSVQNIDQFGSLLTQTMQAGGINPSDIKYANQTLANIRGQLSSPQQAVFDNTLATLKSKVSGLLSVGGSLVPTDVTAEANKIIDGSLPFSALSAVLSRISQEGAILLNSQGNLVNSALKQAQGGNTSSGGGAGGSTASSNFGWNG